ncbi:MAG: NAD(P)/FAD-dependent oxidoreductase [Gammaproteobacteria bacterium]|jgi:cation diffusion facilitator CzcD-associated flavoprotein CzcO|nr:NAD(P)/FAD-dependent oxidoreductase [Gammaproteobacteria bacterium]MBT3867711.1 NAD(P)/FAD-dependent oxidoreductase [Gammaproteobacteria bacterium]MBT4379870.1 NAD(P)/FAD-dependent oxidoreductase [Gammaproteobacteria bacterium]MBT4617881.1 NAD(P)/FAD-dependent oxidoreductase [Gammaproteobacteria bacterium]MBT5199797.1 NAD(P)/FAD-dependent oxidoreductase [Gammaproteobacteria bacterium]
MSHYDVIIVGAGISGISAAVHIQKTCPGKSFTILEARETIGGTWDLFRYPGVRSDSDMHTLGFSFKPWTEAKSIADGPSILKYVNQTTDEFGLRDSIQLGTKVRKAEWSTEEARWQLTVEKSAGETETLTCGFIGMCGGYYNYEQPHDPEFTNMGSFQGKIVHPQFWPEGMDYNGKKVVVIGSGATAMTLVPSMAEKGAQVTMVQRSPTYVVSRPDHDKVANVLRKCLPDSWAYAITRFKNTLMQGYFYRQTRVAPSRIKRQILDGVRAHLGKEVTEKHFTPSYNPWDQRLCLIPNGDLFKAINKGDVQVVTEQIDTFTEDGLKLKNGEVLPADIIVTATGLKLIVLSGVEFVVDGQAVDVPETFSYKGMMFSGIPNMAQTFGYINASWTLRADLTSEYICRLLNHMDEVGMKQATPTLRAEDADMQVRPWIDDFQGGYMTRSMHLFPRQGEGPWRNTQDFAVDKKMVRKAPIADSALKFSNPMGEPGGAFSSATLSDGVSQKEKSTA